MLLRTRATSETEGERKQGEGWNKEESGQMAFQIELWVRGIAESPCCWPSSVWKGTRVTQGDSKRLFKRNDADLCWHTNRNKRVFVCLEIGQCRVELLREVLIMKKTRGHFPPRFHVRLYFVKQGALLFKTIFIFKGQSNPSCSSPLLQMFFTTDPSPELLHYAGKTTKTQKISEMTKLEIL